MKNIYEVQSSNKRKSAFIIVLFLLFTTVVVYVLAQAIGIYMGYEPGGLGFVGLALIISGIMSFGSYWYSDRIVLAYLQQNQLTGIRNSIFILQLKT